MADTGNEEIIRAHWVDVLKVNGFGQVGGIATLPPELSPLNLTMPVSYIFLLEWRSLKAQTCELEIQLQYQEPSLSAAGFPDSTFSLGFSAGARRDAVSEWSWADPVIVKYETGGGANARVFYSDLRPGRFSLGAQERVRMSFARWMLADVGGANVAVQGSIAPSHGTDADPPTYTASIQIPAGTTRQMTAPPGALWWDFNCTVPTQLRATTYQAVYDKNTVLGSLEQNPPVTPYPWLTSNSNIDFENLGAVDTVLTATFWVR